METNPTERSFIPYPTNRVVGTIADAQHADAAVNALVDAGFDRQSIDVLHGDDDLSRLDPTGADHRVLERLQRALIRTGRPVEEYKHLMHHVEDIRAGRFVVMVLAPEREGRTVAADILNAHGAEFVGFYGRWAWQGLTPSSGPAAADGATQAQADAGRPEDIPRLFVEAWNKRDPDALASVFDGDAEFVNVTGLWRHDRASIRKAHAYGPGADLQRVNPHSRRLTRQARVERCGDCSRGNDAVRSNPDRSSQAAKAGGRPLSLLWFTGSPAGGCARRLTTPTWYRTWKPILSTMTERFGRPITAAARCPDQRRRAFGGTSMHSVASSPRTTLVPARRAR